MGFLWILLKPSRGYLPILGVLIESLLGTFDMDQFGLSKSNLCETVLLTGEDSECHRGIQIVQPDGSKEGISASQYILW